MKLKDRIRQKRLEKGYTLEQLADSIGVRKQTIFKYESGVISNIPRDKIEALAAVLDTTPAFLMGWESGSEHRASGSGQNGTGRGGQVMRRPCETTVMIQRADGRWRNTKHYSYVALLTKINDDQVLAVRYDGYTSKYDGLIDEVKADYPEWKVKGIYKLYDIDFKEEE